MVLLLLQSAHFSTHEVDGLLATICPLLHHFEPKTMIKRELPSYMRAVNDVQCNREDVISVKSSQVLAVW